MIYELKFLPVALKEWKKLSPNIQLQFKKKLVERLKSPRVPSCILRGFKDYFKIKLKTVGYRLVYKVVDKQVCVIVIAVGKRDKNFVYENAHQRTSDHQ